MHTYINELGNYLWSQDPRVPGILEDGRCYSNIPLYRYLQAQGDGWKPISAAGHRSAGDKGLDLAEAAMFSISNYVLGDTPAEIRYEQFFSEHEALYTDVEPVTETAVLAHDILIQRFPLIPLSTRNVMFEIILRQQFDDDCLTGKKALILPEEKYLSDEMIRVIHRFVEQGGRLIVYGDAGMYREGLEHATRAYGVAPTRKSVREQQRIENRDEVHRMLEELSKTDAEVIRQFHIQGKSYREISSQLGIPENSIGPTLTRARDKMRRGKVQS